MVELEKVIAGLQNCSYPSENCYYSDCPYRGKRDADKVCLDFLIEDALTVIRDLTEKLKMAKDGRLLLARRCRELEEKLAAVEAERDDLRKDVAAQGEIILELNRDLKRCREALNAQGEYKYLGGDLISREALIERIENVDWYHQTECGTSTVMWQGASSEEEAWFKAPDIFATVREIPAVEAEPVVHAHWEYDDCFKCSACHTEAISYDLDGATRAHHLTKRCPECGAHMDEEVV